jgi:peptidoglycan/LPS O-acetylase OafA/YrhL
VLAPERGQLVNEAPALADAAGAPAAQGAANAPNLFPPAGNPRFPLMDSMRAIAALSVFAGHTVTGVYAVSAHPTLFLWAVQLAYEGVAIFFLISGFLLYRPFLVARREGRPLRLGSYGIRRFLRIAPAYWAALTIFIAAGFVSGVTTGNWWIFYAFGQIYSPVNIGHGIGVAWTLCIEVTFYAALPVFAVLCARLGRGRGSLRPDVILLVVLAVASLAFRAHFSAFTQVATVSTLAGTFFWFALGMGIAIVSVERDGRKRDAQGRTRDAQGRSKDSGRRSAWIGIWPVLSWIVGVLLFVALHQVISKPGFAGLDVPGAVVLTHMLYGLSALFILLPAVFAEHQAGPVQRLLRFRALAWIGLISYAFYLYHTIVIAQLNDVVSDAGISAHYAVVAVSSFFVSIAAAAASYYLLERPVMRWGRSLRRRGRTTPGAAAAR